MFRKYYCIKYIVVCIITLFTNYKCISQEKKKSTVQLSGSLGLFYDLYSFSEDNYASFRPRFPDQLIRFNMQATLKIGKYFSIPFGVNITNQKTLYNLPSLPEENLIDYIQNPANNISINPKYKWIQAFIGTQTPLYSPLSTGDIPMFGVGLELNPGKFILSVNTGVSQRAVEPDPILNIPGAYEQKIQSARIGYGKIEGSKFTLNIVKIKDDVTSVNNTPTNVNPVDGVTISPYFQFKLWKKLELKTETAGSVFTSNVNSNAQIDEDFVEDISDFITINGSSKIDFAHNTRIDWLGQKFQLGGEVKYVGPGFLPVGYRFVERDIFDYKFNTSLKLFKNKVNFTGSFGVRSNNVNDTKLASTLRVITNATVFAQITKQLNISATFSNFGFRNDPSLLNQRIELVNNSYTISPTYQFKTKSIKHQIGANFASSVFDQFDVITNGFLLTKSNNFSLNYNLLFKNFPLNLNLQTIYVDNTMPVGEFSMFNYGFTASYKLFNKKLSPSFALNFANIDRTGFTRDLRTNMNIRLRYKVTKKMRFNFKYRFTGFTYGSSRLNAQLNQNRIQFSLQQQF